ncbi:MAG: thioredoxin domain-containing protein [Chitinispirillales bacterium]|jgi:uncharacterized protein YyaL (SSP411 family)|nr:thioredoxin domain-containing protein [Chitinispirillales bacterium]
MKLFNFHRNNRKNREPNRLINEKSPYLLQHSRNPVDWYPWGEEAFERAKRENKPVFLSIGYSTCHWCHVMERECFNDEQIAALLNKAFVCVKVDREERPDIDDVYMYFCQVITGGGGWPLTMIMTPEKLPFFAATYIPRETSGNLIGMLDLIPQVEELWKMRQEEIKGSALQFTNSLRMFSVVPSVETNDEALLKETYTQIVEQYDSTSGGFGDTPKFPSPHTILFLLRYWKKTGEQKALDISEHTLKAMRDGGLYDHIGFGFHRYATDKEWRVPHFEKMLYDQAMMALTYTEAYQATEKEEYAKTAQEIISYVLRDLRNEQGAFFCAEDSDSEGIEGKYYTWSAEESEKLLGKEYKELAFRTFNIRHGGNVEEIMGRFDGMNILYRDESVNKLSAEFGISSEEFEKRIEAVRSRLLTARKHRIHPMRDEKILTDWNGLMIAALARASRVFENDEYYNAARQAVDFLLDNVYDKTGHSLKHRWKDGEAAIAGYADDYVFLTWGLLELYESRFDTRYLGEAISLNKHLVDHFWDHINGGFFTVADYGEEMLLRRKEIFDDAYPSANSIGLLNQIVLGRIMTSPDFDERISMMKRAFSGEIVRAPSLFSAFIMNYMLTNGAEVIIAGRMDDPETQEMLKELGHQFLPDTVLVFKPTDTENPEIVKYVDFLKDYQAHEGRVTAYVCTDRSCKPPVHDTQKVLEYLKAA